MIYDSKSRFYSDSMKIKFKFVILFILIYIDQSMTTVCNTFCTCDQYQTDIKCKIQWPHTLPMNVTKLSLSNNNMTIFEHGAIKDLPNLKELSLEHNEIKFFEVEAIKNLPSLKKLTIKYNKITHFTKAALKNLPKLEILSLEYNEIMHFNESAIINLCSLKKLAMKGNNITFFNEAAFKDLTKLENVYLYNNTITNIQKGKLKNLNNLKSLYLDGNMLPSIPSTMFQHLPSLEKLILRNNQIKHFEDGSFLFLPNIMEIDLSNNKDLSCGCHLPAVVDYINKTYNRRVIVRSPCNIGLNKNLENLIHPSRNLLCQNYSLFQQKLQCQTCSGIECDYPKVTNCFDVEPFCMSKISMKGDSINVEKSCSTYKKCIEAEKNNIFTCKTLLNGTSCAACCTGNLCNKNDLFGFVELHYSIKFTQYGNSKEFQNTYGIQLQDDMQKSLDFELTVPIKVEYCGSHKNALIINIHCLVFRNISKEERSRNKNIIMTVSNRVAMQKFQIQFNKENFCCESTTLTNQETLHWPITKVGTIAKTPCNANVATRHCVAKLSDSPISNCFWGEPNISECNNTDWITQNLKDIKHYVIEKQNIEDLSKQLLNITQTSLHFKVKDINLAVDIYENIVSQIPNVSTNTIMSYLLPSINNLIDTPEKILIEAEQSKRSANRILDVIEAISENIQLKGDQLRVMYSNLGIGITKVENTHFDGSFYGIISDVNGKATRNIIYDSSYPDTQEENVTVMDFISLPKSLFKQLRKENLLTISKVHFYSMHNDKLFRVIEKSNNKANSKINSHIIAANIPNIQITNLVEPITISLNLLDKTATSLQCAFWDETAGQIPHWSTKGCDTSDYIQGERVNCSCNHLTSFALIMDVYQNEENVKNVKLLSLISNIGCGISFVFLILTVIIHVCFKNIWKLIASKILVNICSSLAVTDLIFLVGMQSYASKSIAVCKTMAALLHYFLLTTMMWMTVEAINIFLSVVFMFKPSQEHFMMKSSVLAWGLPAIIVIITLAINHTNNYIRIAEICWLSKIPFYAALLSPVVISLFINLLVFSLVIWRLISMQIKKKFEHKTRKVRLWGIVGLFFLLGFSWLLAFFAFGKATEVFKYLFVIFSTLQGLFIFIFYCLYKKDTRDIICMYASEQKEKCLLKTSKNKPSSSSTNEKGGTTFDMISSTKIDSGN